MLMPWISDKNYLAKMRSLKLYLSIILGMTCDLSGIVCWVIMGLGCSQCEMKASMRILTEKKEGRIKPRKGIDPQQQR